MVCDPRDIKRSIQRALEIAAMYHAQINENQGVAKSIDDLGEMLEKELGKEIRVFEVDFIVTGKELSAGYMAFENHYEIYVGAMQSRADQRFALCKELFQVVLDEDGYRSLNLIPLLDAIAANLPLEKMELPIASERLSEIAAMEFCLPYADRVNLSEGGENEFMNIDEIAARYDLPESVVSRYCTTASMKYYRVFYD